MRIEPSTLVKDLHRPNFAQPHPAPSLLTPLEINIKKLHLTVIKEKVDTPTLRKQAHLTSQLQQAPHFP
jgi:hypothetical protein